MKYCVYEKKIVSLPLNKGFVGKNARQMPRAANEKRHEMPS